MSFSEEKQIRPVRWRECRVDLISKPFSEYPVYIKNQKSSDYGGFGFFLRFSSTVGLFEVEILYYTECQLSASVFIVTVSIPANMSEYINRNS